MHHKHPWLLLTILFVSYNTYAESVLVFGVPLGGKPATAIKKCQEDSSKVKSLCWVDKPYSAKGIGTLGSAHLPYAALPEWALGTLPKVALAQTGEIERVAFSGDELYPLREDITRSISARFGRPSERELSGAGVWRTWYSDSVEIRLLCAPGRCSVDFLSAADVKKRELAAEAGAAATRARPISP